jgi:1,4-dihydroxy-6-naphthoate synthase
MTAAPLELVFSTCPNDTFVFHAWAHGLLADAPAVRVRHADVDEANDLAARGVPDVVKVSYAALPWLLSDYRLLRAGGALGRGCGPLVLTAGSSELTGARVAVPGQRTTAYLLFRLWAAGHQLGSIEVVPFPQIMPAVRAGRFDAGVVIHEARFTYAEYGLTCLADLGNWWAEQTGLPIPLGAILARRSLDTAAITATIQASVDRAWAYPDASADYVRSVAQELSPEVITAHIGLYVNSATRSLSDVDETAVRTLLSRAADRGLVPALAADALD